MSFHDCKMKMAIWLAAAIAFFFVVYVPVCAYLNNPQEFMQVRPWLMFATAGCGMVFLTVLIAGIFCLLRCTMPVAHVLFVAMAAGCTIALFVQGNLINLDYGILDGRAIDWDAMMGAGVLNTVIWTVLVMSFLALALIFGGRAIGMLSCVAKVFLAYMVLVLGMRLASVELVDERPYEFTEDRIYELSSKDNVLIFIIDSFDQAMADKLLIESEGRFAFKDFTYLQNTIGCFSYTHLGVPQIVTGRAYNHGHAADNRKAYIRYLNWAYADSDVISAIESHGYVANFYTSETAPSFLPDNVKGVIQNIWRNEELTIDDVGKSIFLPIKSSVFTYLPHFAKRYYHAHMDRHAAWFGSDKPHAVGMYERETNAQKHFEVKGFQLVDQKKYNIYHYDGVHLPGYNEEKAKSVLRLLRLTFDRLKQSGVYDGSAIFVLGDHGCADRARPMLLYKDRGVVRETLTVSDAPFSYHDLGRLFVQAISGEKIEIPSPRNPRIYVHGGLYNGAPFVTNKYDLAGLSIENVVPKDCYTCNDHLPSRCISWPERRVQEGTTFWMLGDSACLDVPVPKALQNRPLNINIDTSMVLCPQNPRRTVTFFANDVKIRDVEYRLPDGADQSVDLTVAPELAKDKLRLKFNVDSTIVPSVVLPGNNDCRPLGLGLRRISLASNVIFGNGFSVAENGGRWTDGTNAILRVGVPVGCRGKNVRVGLSVWPFLPGKGITNQTVCVGSAAKSLYVGNLIHVGIHSISFPVPADLVKDGVIELELGLPDAVSPRDAGVGNDTRKLAIFLRSCEVNLAE